MPSTLRAQVRRLLIIIFAVADFGSLVAHNRRQKAIVKIHHHRWSKSASAAGTRAPAGCLTKVGGIDRRTRRLTRQSQRGTTDDGPAASVSRYFPTIVCSARLCLRDFPLWLPSRIRRRRRDHFNGPGLDRLSRRDFTIGRAWCCGSLHGDELHQLNRRQRPACDLRSSPAIPRADNIAAGS